MPDKEWAPLPDAHYGKITEQPKEGDPLPELGDDDDDDAPHDTDPDLIEMLGFDPKEWENEDEDSVTVANQDGSISKRKR